MGELSAADKAALTGLLCNLADVIGGDGSSDRLCSSLSRALRIEERSVMAYELEWLSRSPPLR